MGITSPLLVLPIGDVLHTCAHVLITCTQLVGGAQVQRQMAVMMGVGAVEGIPRAL